MDAEILNVLANGIIEPSESLYSDSTVLIRRITHQFWQTQRDYKIPSATLPDVNLLFSQLGNANTFQIWLEICQ